MVANDMPCCGTMFWVYLVISAALVAFTSLMSGLTLGLMSLSLVDLEVLTKAGQPEDRKKAVKILPIVKNQHLLLCTLVICNTMAVEALPIFLDAILPAWHSILISVTLILAFGEIIPHAVCSRYGLSIGAKLSVVVWLLVIVFFPISYPISKLLDFLLGKGHSALLRRAELKTLVDMHGNESGKGGELTHHETTIISGALDLTQKTARDAMTPMSEVFSLDLNSKLKDETMSLIMSKGHSRVPVYSGNPTNIIGLVLVKNLIKCRPEDETPIRNLTIRRIPRVHDRLPLYDILNLFQNGHSHMAVVVSCKSHLKGIAENSTAEHDMVKININSNSTQRLAEERGIDCQDGQNKQTKIYRYASSVASSDTETQSPSFDVKITNEFVEPFSNSDEEIIGIITMEDVLEELLQEPILDETDEYIDVHNKIKINILSRSLRSPGAASASRLNLRTPVASSLPSSQQTPVSSYHHTPILRSPVSPYIGSPFMRPTLCASPGIFIPTSPAGVIGPVRSSPSSHRISRKSYEKLRKPGVLIDSFSLAG